MKLQLEIYGALCSTSVFKINDIDADYSDFGSKWDQAPEDAQEYGCGDMRFEKDSPSKEVLDKYKITEGEFDEIAEKLEDGLSFGSCGWCV
jgi:hypothetical protein